MREKPKDIGRLHHINNAIENIQEFLKDRSAEDFLTDKMLYFAVVKNMEIIGEAAYMLTEEFRNSYPFVQWKDIIRMRHILVHGYYQVDSKIVWITIKKDLPILCAQIKQIIQEIDSSQNP